MTVARTPASQFRFASQDGDRSRLPRRRSDLPIYLFSGSEDPVGQQLEGVRVLIDRYRRAGIREIDHDFYLGGRHEMRNEINCAEVRANLLPWISHVLERWTSLKAS